MSQQGKILVREKEDKASYDWIVENAPGGGHDMARVDSKKLRTLPAGE